jgi:hypothetical protein
MGFIFLSSESVEQLFCDIRPCSAVLEPDRLFRAGAAIVI